MDIIQLGGLVGLYFGDAQTRCYFFLIIILIKWRLLLLMHVTEMKTVMFVILLCVISALPFVSIVMNSYARIALVLVCSAILSYANR